MSKRIMTRTIIAAMWASGRPTDDARFANVYRAALKAGLNDRQAMALVNQAYDAANLYEWSLPDGSALQYATRRRQAAESPNGKWAEEFAAQAEGRTSRWGTPEFHGVKQ